MRITVLVFGFVGCGNRQQAALPPPQALDRVGAPVVSPDCALSSTCPDAVAGLDAQRCIGSGEPFVVEYESASGGILDVRVDETALAALELDPGHWWTVFADPGGACERAVAVKVFVEVHDAVE